MNPIFFGETIHIAKLTRLDEKTRQETPALESDPNMVAFTFHALLSAENIKSDMMTIPHPIKPVTHVICDGKVFAGEASQIIGPACILTLNPGSPFRKIPIDNMDPSTHDYTYWNEEHTRLDDMEGFGAKTVGDKVIMEQTLAETEEEQSRIEKQVESERATLNEKYLNNANDYEIFYVHDENAGSKDYEIVGLQKLKKDGNFTTLA